jgi:acetyl esterase/lipase
MTTTFNWAGWKTLRLRRTPSARELAIGVLVAAGFFAASVFALLKLSPWPSALAIRFLFDTGGRAENAAIAKYVPYNIVARLDRRYDAADPDALLDAYYPAEIEGSAQALPTIVWIHGGGFVAGDKSQAANYLKVLAGKGFVTIAVNYALAPRHLYPTPLREVNIALGYITAHARDLHVDASRIVLGGDSAGAHIAAQVANIITNPGYAKAVGIMPSIAPGQLAGALMYCGPFDVGVTHYTGPLGWIGTTAVWAYSGTRRFDRDPYFATASVTDHLSPRFPPAFITAGNGDPLLPESKIFAEALARQGVRVDTLFFPSDFSPAAHHDYQFALQTEAGRRALSRSLDFLSAVTRRQGS